MKRVTIKDIAKIAGVSYATVSRSLSDSPEISEATKSRILEICKAEGYYKNSLAKGLVNHKSYLLGLIVPDISNNFFSEIALEIETYARGKGYHIILCNSNHCPQTTKEAFEFLMSHQADGIILVSTQAEVVNVATPFAKRVPTVIIGDLTADLLPLCHAVSTDNYLGGKLAAEFLAKLRHRHIAYVGYRPNNSVHQQRFQGFNETAQKYNQLITVIENDFSNSSSIKVGYQLAKSLLKKPLQQTAIFAATDSIALGILQAAEELNLKVPQDFSLLGFDNCSYSSLPGIHLTTIDQCNKEQAQLCIDLLLDQMNKESTIQLQTHSIPTKLCVRKTCTALIKNKI